MRLALQEITRTTGGRLIGPVKSKKLVFGVSTDTRKLRRGDLFVALRGVHYDGHDYLRVAIRKGAAALMVQKRLHLVQGSRCPMIFVADTFKALGDLAAYWRNRFSIPIIAVTGSNGKTTTKDMIAAILAQKYRVLKTEGNYNNLIGLPLTLFRLNERHQCAVLECGMSQKGEMDRLAKIVQPQIGVVTNVGMAHLAGLKSLRAVAQEKARLYAHLPVKGRAIVNHRSNYRKFFKKVIPCPTTTFGLATSATVRGKQVHYDEDGRSHFVVVTAQRKFSVSLPIPGEGNVENALAAIAATRDFHIPTPLIQKSLREFQPTGHRSRIVALSRGLRLIDDCYNANPDSMKQAIGLLRQLGKGQMTVAVLGDMFELGKWTPSEHRQIGELIARSGISVLVTIGRWSKEIYRAAQRKGLSRDCTFHFENITKALKEKKRWLPKRGLILVKASRGMKLEILVEALIKNRKRKRS